MLTQRKKSYVVVVWSICLLLFVGSGCSTVKKFLGWEEKEENQPPNIPSNPSPSDGATAQSIDVDLSWTGGDPDTVDTVTYDVYFQTNPSPEQLVSNDQSATTYDPGTLSYNTTYYWKIIATDNHGASTNGPVWHFLTPPPVGTVENPVTWIIFQVVEVRIGVTANVGIVYPEQRKLLHVSGELGPGDVGEITLGPYAVPPEEFVFYVVVGGNMFLSTDPSYCKIERIGPNTISYSWDVDGDYAFNDVVFTVAFLFLWEHNHDFSLPPRH